MRNTLRNTRVRLTVAYTAIVLAVSCIGAGLAWVLLTRADLSEVDATLLHAQGRLLAYGIVATAGGYGFGQPVPESGYGGGSAVVEYLVLGSGDSVLLASDAGPTVPDLSAVTARVPSNHTAIVDTIASGGHSVRVLARSIDLPEGRPATLVLSTSLAAYDSTVALTALYLGLAAAGITGLAAISSYWLAGRVLRPVHHITSIARGMSEHSLHQRITLDLPDDEIGELAATFNTMLSRLETAFVPLRRFTADAAHELRAPLAVLTTEVEVALAHEREPDEYRATLATVHSETQRLNDIANQLLTLARADAGALVPILEPVFISDLLEELVDRWQTVAAERRVRIATNLPNAGQVDVDVEMMRSLVDNLMSNALRHARSDGTVTVTAEVDTDTWTLMVEDDGPGVADAFRPILFERFARGEPARERGSGGAGLGLAICLVIAEAHGGHISLDDDPTHPARFRVRLSRTGHPGGHGIQGEASRSG